MDDPVDEVLALFAVRGRGHYGEAVDQLRHATQCGGLAEAAGASDELVAAALLHDIGHLLGVHSDPAGGSPAGDDRHEAVGARWLRHRFGPHVAAPVALHVLAKRYWCTVDPTYLATLTPTSMTSLELQGGLLGPEGAARFVTRSGAEAALALRVWDESAKDPGAPVVDLGEFTPILRRVAERERSGR